MANIGTSIAAWSTTEASNQPDGSDSATIVGDLRAIQAGVRYLRTNDTIASASTCDLGSKDAEYLSISGTVSITALGTVSAGIVKRVVFENTLTLTHNGTSLILPGAANISTAAGDAAEFVSLGSGNWRCTQYQKANVAPIDFAALGGFRNKIINGGFGINQRGYVSGAAVGAGLYGHDRWKMAASADTYTYSTTNNKTTVTIPAGKVLQQVVEGLNLQSGTYVLTWEGTAQGKIGAGSYGSTGITGSITGGTNTTIEFGPGTVANVQLELGAATPFEPRSVGQELALCQRYYYRVTPAANDQLADAVSLVTNTAGGAGFRFPVTLRSVPTALEQSGTAGDYGVSFANVSTACSAVPTFSAATSEHYARLQWSATSGHTAGQGGILYSVNTSAYLGFSAEL